MTHAFNFTKTSLDKLPIPMKGKRFSYRDVQVRKLSFVIHSSGVKSFYVVKKIDGRTEKIFLGQYPDLTIDNARKLAMAKLGQIAVGINPMEDKRAVRAEMTLGQLFDQYMSRFSKAHKKTWQADAKDFPRFFGHWFGKKLSQIKKQDVQVLIENVYAENGLHQANKTLQRLQAVFNKAIDWGWKGSNPTSGIKKYKTKSRDRFIQPHEMPFLLQALNDELDQDAKDYFWLLLLTGVRKTNAAMMRWEDINWARQEWRIPETKNGDPIIIPLVSMAIQILENRKRKTNSPWIFPAKTDASKYFTGFRFSWVGLIQKATIHLWQSDEALHQFVKTEPLTGLTATNTMAMFNKMKANAKAQKITLPVGLMDLRIHDIRRTFGSYQALTGASLQVIGKSLGHRSTEATQIYARLNLDPVRASIEKATAAMVLATA